MIKLRPYLPAIVWMGMVLFLTTKEPSGLPKIQIQHLDKLVHGVLFGGTSLFLLLGLKKKNPEQNFLGTLAVLTSISYGVVIECIQFFLPYRSFSFEDMVANTLGAVLAFDLYCLLKK